MSEERTQRGNTAAAAAAAAGPDSDNADAETTTDDEAYLEGSADEDDESQNDVDDDDEDGDDDSGDAPQARSVNRRHWPSRYVQLLDFYGTHGHSRVKESDDLELFKWCKNQRTKYRWLKQGKKKDGNKTPLTQEQVDLLKKANFTFNIHDRNWHDRYDELRTLVAKNGSIDIPTIKNQKPEVAAWIVHQQNIRVAQQKGLPQGDMMTTERLELLEQINFPFRRRKGWMGRYQELLEFKKENGHCDVPSARYSKWTSLGNWVLYQRERYTKYEEGRSDHSLSDEKIELLKKIGFKFRCKEKPKDWMYRYNEMVEYKNKYGDCLVPKNWPVNKQLYSFVYHARSDYAKFCVGKRSPMTQEKADLLNEIGFAWRLREPRFPKSKRKWPPEDEEIDQGKELQRKAAKLRREARDATYEYKIAQNEADKVAAEAARLEAIAAEKDSLAKTKWKEANDIGDQAIAAMSSPSCKKKKITTFDPDTDNNDNDWAFPEN